MLELLSTTQVVTVTLDWRLEVQVVPFKYQGSLHWSKDPAGQQVVSGGLVSIITNI